MITLRSKLATPYADDVAGGIWQHRQARYGVHQVGELYSFAMGTHLLNILLEFEYLLEKMFRLLALEMILNFDV